MEQRSIWLTESSELCGSVTIGYLLSAKASLSVLDDTATVIGIAKVFDEAVVKRGVVAIGVSGDETTILARSIARPNFFPRKWKVKLV